MCVLKAWCAYSLCPYLPSLVVLPTAIAITTHISALLSGWTVQVTVMECSTLLSLGVTSVATTSVTDGATGITYTHMHTHIIKIYYVPPIPWLALSMSIKCI